MIRVQLLPLCNFIFVATKISTLYVASSRSRQLKDTVQGYFNVAGVSRYGDSSSIKPITAQCVHELWLPLLPQEDLSLLLFSLAPEQQGAKPQWRPCSCPAKKPAEQGTDKTIVRI
jgi:hypothetical protein